MVRRIYRSCRANEPDIGLNFEIADLVNEKQGSAPREAASAVVKFINDKDPFICVNALTLLDCLVKNCGYPFHLQISRKDFLNELVKRFPEKPPHKYNKVQRLVLAQIEEWNETICKSSRHKKDLGFIRDMHRLLSYKGYIFPEINKSDIAVLNPSDNIKSVAEIQKEERLAQSAKLQELVRRGRPEDLKEANKLMKIMSGFHEDEQLNQLTKQRVAEDVSKIKGKVEVFSDMVNSYSADGDKETQATLDELYSSLKVAQPAIKSMAEQEHDETSVGELLTLNDTIHLLIEKYALLKNKDLDGASKINVNSTGGINLIDFDDEPATTPGEQPREQSNNLMDLLGDLDLSNKSTPVFGGIALSSTPTPTPPPQQSSAFESLNQLQNLDILSSAPLNQGTVSQQNTAASIQQSLGPSTPPAADNLVTVNTSSYLKLAYQLNKPSTGGVELVWSFSNLSLNNISKLTFLVAVPKNLKLELSPQSNNFLLSMASNGITQLAKITGDVTSSIKLKWKCTYIVDSVTKEETGIYTVTI